MWSIDELQAAWRLVGRLHYGQKYAGQKEGEDFEYLNHIGSVTFEVLNALNFEKDMNADLAIQCAILHDSVEDTEYAFEDVAQLFGMAVAKGVMALTKNETLDSKAAMMQDSLKRIKEQPKEVWAVKLADRICNLCPPPHYWNNDKRIKYRKEAQLIHRELKAGNQYLADRLENKINDYSQYIK